ncbi:MULTISPECIES: hypothetical protein [unclassified Anabaena]|uniref:hypothetical protein n=1 Tax=unclassified Anabaena TaxID=2619674 RepID=UPI001445F59A|nr:MULTISPECIES: hypothetical protein [unclassified Anabaena]MTJ06148.1 hypothetical protein [Anabaena sp. UHCC 0204]MTJ54764.1 hypothetical protein [Anabaena sp. UHCC 0253]
MIVEFSIFTRYPKFEGIPVGRLYVSHSFLTHPLFLSWLPLFHVIGERSYIHTKCIWFIAPVSLYYSLASRYPNPRFAAYTLYLLRNTSTFFRGLKPPHLPDSQYFD